MVNIIEIVRTVDTLTMVRFILTNLVDSNTRFVNIHLPYNNLINLWSYEFNAIPRNEKMTTTTNLWNLYLHL